MPGNKPQLNDYRETIMSDQVIPVGNSFVASINDVATIFATAEEANTAIIAAELGAGFAARAAAFCEANGIEGKDQVTKTNQIVKFLTYEATAVGVEESDEETDS